MSISLGRFFLVIIFAALASSCGAYLLDSAQNDLRDSFASGDFESTSAMMESLEKKGVYTEKDAVLLNLEKGSAYHFSGDYSASNSYFEQAEFNIEDLYTKSISRALKSFLVNDNQLSYDGEDYEDVYLNVFKALNYIHLEDFEGALVETRRISYKLDQINTKYRGLVETLSKADTTNTGSDKWSTGKSNIQNSTLGYYLATILYAKTNKPDDARISYQNLLKAHQEQSSYFLLDAYDYQKFDKLTNPDAYNVLIKAFSGRSPMKVQDDSRIYFEDSDTYIKFSFPVLLKYQSEVYSVSVSVNGTTQEELATIEHLDKVAGEVYKVKEPLIIARTMVRATLKSLASNRASNKVSEKNEGLGSLLNFLGKLAQETTEKADLRGWQTMPGTSHATVLSLPAGVHSVRIDYLDRRGKVLFFEEQEIEVTENDALKLVESIYWN
ncbi:MAG: hypothetical protein JJ895_07175 [Balneolaceae bacterium]|nr:hypothetical protein [Balneolaceae bacterium]